MAARPAFGCLAVALAAVLAVGSVSARCAATSQAASGVADAAPGSARLIIESGAHVYTHPRLTRTGAILHERVSIFRHRVSLIQSRPGSVEWGFAVACVPDHGITIVGATARIPLSSAMSAIVDVSTALTINSAALALPSAAGWGVGLEWEQITDPLVLSARIGYTSHAADDGESVSIGGSVSLLVNDHVSLSAAASVSGTCQGIVSPALGTSLTYRQGSGDILYVRVDASLAPSDSASVVIGISRELGQQATSRSEDEV